MVFIKNNDIFNLFLYFIFISKWCAAQDSETAEATIQKATTAATEAFTAFNQLFVQCLYSKTASKKFLIDNMQQFINRPARTTVGLAPKFTANRKFFANMITNGAFKEMLAKDEDEIWGSLVQKIKYCDTVVMDQEILKEYFGRDDLTKL